jgi:hypothetical protein
MGPDGASAGNFQCSDPAARIQFERRPAGVGAGFNPNAAVEANAATVVPLLPGEGVMIRATDRATGAVKAETYVAAAPVRPPASATQQGADSTAAAELLKRLNKLLADEARTPAAQQLPYLPLASPQHEAELTGVIRGLLGGGGTIDLFFRDPARPGATAEVEVEGGVRLRATEVAAAHVPKRAARCTVLATPATAGAAVIGALDWLGPLLTLVDEHIVGTRLADALTAYAHARQATAAASGTAITSEEHRLVAALLRLATRLADALAELSRAVGNAPQIRFTVAPGCIRNVSCDRPGYTLYASLDGGRRREELVGAAPQFPRLPLAPSDVPPVVTIEAVTADGKVAASTECTLATNVKLSGGADEGPFHLDVEVVPVGDETRVQLTVPLGCRMFPSVNGVTERAIHGSRGAVIVPTRDACHMTVRVEDETGRTTVRHTLSLPRLTHRCGEILLEHNDLRVAAAAGGAGNGSGGMKVVAAVDGTAERALDGDVLHLAADSAHDVRLRFHAEHVARDQTRSWHTALEAGLRLPVYIDPDALLALLRLLQAYDPKIIAAHPAQVEQLRAQLVQFARDGSTRPRGGGAPHVTTLAHVVAGLLGSVGPRDRVHQPTHVVQFRLQGVEAPDFI